MASKRRLGRSLNELLAAENRIGANKALSQIVGSVEPEDHEGEETPLPEFNMFGKPRTKTPPPEESKDHGFTIDYSTQHVEFEPQPPTGQYGLGPDKSTRVAAHKFVPDSENKKYLVERAGVKTHTEKLGTVYVMFWKPGRQGKVWQYEKVPETTYYRFSNSTSKGRFINNELNAFSKGPVRGRDGIFHASELGENEFS